MAFIDTVFSWISTIQLVLLYGWPFIILLWIGFLKLKWKNWPVDVVIIEKRGSNLVKTNDRAGKYIDPYSGIIGYKLQKAKDTFPVINYDWVMHNVTVHNTLFDRFVNLIRGNIGTLFLFRYGSKQYKPVLIKVNGKRRQILKELKNPDGSTKIIRIYEQLDPRKYLGTLDFEVIDWDNMNFMIQEQRASIMRRQKKTEFMKQILIPLVTIIAVALVCIIMIKFSYDYAVGMRTIQNPTPSKPATVPNIPVISDVVPGG